MSVKELLEKAIKKMPHIEHLANRQDAYCLVSQAIALLAKPEPNEFTKLIKERNIISEGDLHELKCVLKKACDIIDSQQAEIGCLKIRLEENRKLGKGHKDRELANAKKCNEYYNRIKELAKEPVCKTCGGSRKVLIREQPCGCILCICAHPTQCQGCGAKLCEKHKNTGLQKATSKPCPDCQEPEPKTERKCEDCEFWKENEINPLIAVQQATKRWGECRRYAPRLVMAGNSVDIECDKDWAETNPDDWCGEFKPKEG